MSTTPERIRLRRTKGWRMPAGAVKVDRSTLFGNPFIPGEPNGLGWGDVRDTEHAVWLYRQWLVTPSRSIAYEIDRHDEILRNLPRLAGRTLACWCTAGAHCHADALLALANRDDVTAVVAMLLDGTAPHTRTEDAIALAQLARAQGLGPDEVPQLGAKITALADEIRAVRAAAATPKEDGTDA